MKRILEKLLVVSLMFIATLSIAMSNTTSLTYADDTSSKNSPNPISNCTPFLGMKPWNCGLEEWKEEVAEDGSVRSTIKSNNYQIIENIAEDGVTIVGYVALGYRETGKDRTT